MAARETGIIEIKSPMQESFYPVFVQLQADDPVAGRGHAEETVGNTEILRTAVVHPQVFRAFAREKRLQRVGGYDGRFADPFGKIRIVTHGVHYRETFQESGRLFLCRPVLRYARFVRFVGNMENRPLPDMQPVELRRQGRQESQQELPVVLPERIAFPSETLLQLTVLSDHDLRAMGGSPLGIEMHHLEILYAAVQAHGHPAPQPGEIKRIRIICYFDVNQLDRRSFPAGLGVQRRREERREDHAQSAPHAQPDLAPHIFPVEVGENRDMVIIGDAVPVEPFRDDQFLRRQDGVDDFEMCFDGQKEGFFGIILRCLSGRGIRGRRLAGPDSQPDRIDPGRRIPAGFDLHPECSPDPERDRAFPVRKRRQQIRV